MECDNYTKNGHVASEIHVRGSRVGFGLDAGDARALRLDVAAGLPVAYAVSARHHTMVPAHTLHHVHRSPPPDHPFMSTMDEISYWIYTKRAPCLMNYDNAIKKQHEEAHCSKTKPKSVPSVAEVPSPKKKKKRKLSLLDDDSGSAEKQQNVYFDTSQNKKQTVMSSCKSDTLRSDIDFNIKIPSVQEKPKRSKPPKSSRTTLHKKNKVVTSTPKVARLRRSLRQAQQSLNNNSQLNSSFEVFNPNITNGDQKHNVIEEKTPDKTKKSTELLAGGDQSTDNKKNTTINKLSKSKSELLNGQFEDLSDVSGFTANYIRSTKLQSTKTPRKLRCKNNRSLVKESRQSMQKDSTMVICVNKSVNTAPKSAVHDCSTDSVNVINLVTKSTDKTVKLSKTTSLLKFMESTPGNDSVSNNRLEKTRKNRANLNVSFQSRSSTSRYPKRHRNHSTTQDETEALSEDVNQGDKKHKISKNCSEFNNSDRKENPEATPVSRTRSGRNIGLTIRHPENSVLVLSNSTEQVSSMVSMNVASPVGEPRERKKKRITRHVRSKKVNDRHASLQRDALRDKSGFTACFSDSDDDSEPLKMRKFFCA